MKKESFKEYIERIGINLEDSDEDVNLARKIYFGCIYSYEQKLNWRRQVVRIKKILKELR